MANEREESFCLWIMGLTREAMQKEYARQNPNPPLSLNAPPSTEEPGGQRLDQLATSVEPDSLVDIILSPKTFLEFSRDMARNTSKKKVEMWRERVYILERRLRFEDDWWKIAQSIGRPETSIQTQYKHTRQEFGEWLVRNGIVQSRDEEVCRQERITWENHDENTTETTDSAQEEDNGL